jgi:helix-turn-helix protein|tara:strand:+ start:435 stop:620 length:186 start_codon:yes stop_codon:yes gene_type:complete
VKSAKIIVSDDDVTLEIDDVENCQFELWTVDKKTTSCVKIKIPDEVWSELVNEWKQKRGVK